MLSKREKQMLLSEGFLPSEIYAYSHATAGSIGNTKAKRHIVTQNFDFNSRTFRAARRSRMRWVRDLKSLGWTDGEIKSKIREYYDLGSKRSPFDWLKLAYAPPHRISDLQSALVKKIRARASRTYGKLYGRNLRTATKVRTQPKRPVVPTKPRRIIRVRKRR